MGPLKENAVSIYPAAASNAVASERSIGVEAKDEVEGLPASC
jgi:hypothetical protein